MCLLRKCHTDDMNMCLGVAKYSGSTNGVAGQKGSETLHYTTNLAMFNYIIKQFPTSHIFHNHKDICWSTDHLIPSKQTQTKE